MPISNKSSQKHMTETSIRINSAEAYRRQQGLTTQRKPVMTNNITTNATRPSVRSFVGRDAENSMF